MIEFKEYQGKPTVRYAFQITDKHELIKLLEQESTYVIAEKGSHTQAIIKFKAHEEVKEGDWVVKLTDSDTYHVSDKVFRERNVVSDED